MSKEQILKAELDKITDKVFSFCKPEKKEANQESKNKKAGLDNTKNKIKK